MHDESQLLVKFLSGNRTHKLGPLKKMKLSFNDDNAPRFLSNIACRT